MGDEVDDGDDVLDEEIVEDEDGDSVLEEAMVEVGS